MNKQTWRFGVFALTLVFPRLLTAQTPQPTPLTINESQIPIRVDGHLNDWPSARMLVLDQASQVVSGKAFWKGPEDFNGKIFITFDSLYLYISAIVEKKTPPVNSNESLSLWNGDCLELFLSTQSRGNGPNRLSAGDYHIGFSPGTDCKNPQLYCFNKNSNIVGGRVISRVTKTGYLMEACVPLSFFGGLDLGPGKNAGLDVALDEGGQVSGNRLMQLDYAKDPQNREHPGSWQAIQWSGTDSVSVPLKEQEDLYAGEVRDGTKGATYAGMRNVSGLVLDGSGKPMAGARVSTWPKTKETLTDSTGAFELIKIKIYDKTLLYARREGTSTALAPLLPKGKPVTLFPKPYPATLFGPPNAPQSLVLGLTLPLSEFQGIEKVSTGSKERPFPLKFSYLRLTGTDAAVKNPGSERTLLDQFVAYARSLGAEPVIEVPLNLANPADAGQWVRYCNLEKKYNVQYWSVGDEPDISGSGGSRADSQNYSAYDYINDFREAFNAMKSADPSILILGPELAGKYSDGENDWLTPFIRYDGDIADLVSLHRYAALKAGDCSAKSLGTDLRSEVALLHNLRDKISSNSAINIPLVVTGGNTCREKVEEKNNTDDSGPESFGAALWLAEKAHIALKERMGWIFFTFPNGTQGLDALPEKGPRPPYWALRILSSLPPGKVVSAVLQQDNMSVCAIQDEKSKDLTLLLINHGDRYYRPKIRLDGKDSDLSVEAGLKQGVDFEIPSYSFSCLRIKADNSPGTATVYTYKMFQSGKEPETKVLPPW